MRYVNQWKQARISHASLGSFPGAAIPADNSSPTPRLTGKDSLDTLERRTALIRDATRRRRQRRHTASSPRPCILTEPRLMSLWFRRHVLSRPWLAFLVLGLAFFVFGACTIHLGLMFTVNLELLRDHGWRAAMDGAALQLLELVATGYVAVASYVVLKTCEHRLSQWLSGDDHAVHDAGAHAPGRETSSDAPASKP